MSRKSAGSRCSGAEIEEENINFTRKLNGVRTEITLANSEERQKLQHNTKIISP
jgi:hypothetical protein